MASLGVSELKELMKTDPELVLIDVRTEGEVADGRIPGAKWMDLSDRNFMSDAIALPKDRTYCFYCASGGRTSMVVPFMEMNGFTKVYDLEGGIMGWIEAGGDTL